MAPISNVYMLPKAERITNRTNSKSIQTAVFAHYSIHSLLKTGIQTSLTTYQLR